MRNLRVPSNRPLTERASLRSIRSATSCLVALAFLSACESPVDDDLIESLGPEVEGVDEGEFHRFGQPCLACHGGYGEGPDFGVAGTVFVTPAGITPMENARVIITDAVGQQIELTTNCAGNFYAPLSQFTPVFPLRAEVVCPLGNGTERRNVMGTRIHRQGGCASCHVAGGPTQSSPGQIYCFEEMPTPPILNDPSCPGGPGK
jgi:hypothetical protein